MEKCVLRGMKENLLRFKGVVNFGSKDFERATETYICGGQNLSIGP